MAITLDGNNTGTVGVINSATAVASTSGTSIDFTGIPSGVKRITVMFNGVSTNGTSNLQIQIGSGSFVTTGYLSDASQGASGTNATTGFIQTVSVAAASASARYGQCVLTLVSSNTWISSAINGPTDNSSAVSLSVGGISLGGTLDRVRITTVNGTDTFDAGSINILYE